MTLAISPVCRLLLAGILAFFVAACQTSGEGAGDPTRQTAQTALPAGGSAPAEETAQGRYFIEFRSRYAYTYGHSYVIFGRLDEAGNMIDPEVAGLHPASENVVPYLLGHIFPVPAETGWSDGDLEDEYMSANWRIFLSEDRYRQVVADIRKLQRNSRSWHAALYNCNAFVGQVARLMGYDRIPFIWTEPRLFITGLREMNGGPDAIGITRPGA